MNDSQDVVVSQEKFDEMVKELEHLKTVRRTEIAKNLEYARSLGDLSENAEYQEARDLQSATEERIKKLEELVKNTKILTDGKKKNEVGFNSAVSIKKEGSGDLHEYTIVGSEE
ncbi:MAG: transcription elongation factor GreA, partial [Patescibacteria group bacterium]